MENDGNNGIVKRATVENGDGRVLDIWGGDRRLDNRHPLMDIHPRLEREPHDSDRDSNRRYRVRVDRWSLFGFYVNE